MPARNHFLTVLSALSLCVYKSASQGNPPGSPTDEMKFEICDAEGFLALNMARQYIVLKDPQERILSYVGKKEPGLRLARELFERVDAKTITHHAAYGAEKLNACAQREGVRLNGSTDVAQICYARSDIPFFLARGKNETLNKADGIKKVRGMLKSTNVYPEGLMTSMANVVYDARTPLDTQKLMGAVFWTCMNSDEWAGKR